MLTYDDFLAFAGLDDDAVQAVARRNHLPCSVAVALAGMILPHGAATAGIERAIRSELETARRRRDPVEAARLRLMLRDLPARPTSLARPVMTARKSAA